MHDPFYDSEILEEIARRNRNFTLLALLGVFLVGLALGLFILWVMT